MQNQPFTSGYVPITLLYFESQVAWQPAWHTMYTIAVLLARVASGLCLLYSLPRCIALQNTPYTSQDLVVSPTINNWRDVGFYPKAASGIWQAAGLTLMQRMATDGI